MSIAIVQAGTVIYDTPATLDKLERLTMEAVHKGAKLVLFPEGFVGGYPKGMDFGIVVGQHTAEGSEEFRKYYNSAIEEHGPESQRMAKLAITHKIIMVVGVIERDVSTLYCAVFDTPLGKIGGAICWENYMPLYRVLLYSKGIQLYMAPAADDLDRWLPTVRMIALEGRTLNWDCVFDRFCSNQGPFMGVKCFVFSAIQFLTTSDFPDGHSIRLKHGNDKVLLRGGSCAIDPQGNVLVEPNYTKETIQPV
nr:Nitrilase cyanide hydratase and apolipoprotein N-acyltransferase domain containing protein [Haemonchus contortus]